MTDFNHLFLSPEWLKEYHTKYPHGLSVMENLIDWLNRVNELIDYINLSPDKIREILAGWKEDGTLEVLINEVLFETKEDIARARERGINIKYFGAVGDGVTNDYPALALATAVARTISSKIFFPPGTYLIDGANGMLMAPMTGNNATIKFVGNLALLYDTSMEISNLQIETDYEMPTTASIGTLFQCNNDGVDFFLIKNVRFSCPVSNLDGSVRGKTLARVIAKKVVVSNLESRNVSSGLTIQSTAAGDTDSVIVDNVRSYNSKGTLYIKGSYLTETDTIMRNVYLTNISQVNTLSQQGKTNAVNGSDTILVERVQNLNIINTYCERARERALYLNMVWDVTVENTKFKNTEGIKVCGYIDITQGIEEYTENVVVNNTHMIGGYDKRAFIIYNVKKVTIDGVHVQNTFDTAASHIFELNLQVRDLIMNNITGSNARRGIVVFNSVKVPEGNHYFKNIIISNVKFDNPCQQTYSAIRNYIDPLITDDFLVYNLVLLNIDIDSAILNGIDTDQRWQQLNGNSNLRTICEMERVNWLTAHNISGNSLRDVSGFILTNCTNVTVPASV